ncbi:hypothetical protein D3C85_1291100 [compost metagenome]
MPEERLASERPVCGCGVHEAEAGEAALDQPGSEEGEVVLDEAAIGSGHVALGATLYDFGRQPIPEGVAGQAALAAAAGQDGSRKSETGLDHRLGAEGIENLDGARQGRWVMAGDAIDETCDLQGLGGAEIVPVLQPGVAGQGAGRGAQKGKGATGKRMRLAVPPSGLADQGP